MVAVSHAINECQQIWCPCWWRNNAPGVAPGEAAAIAAVSHTEACTSIFGVAVGGIANFFFEFPGRSRKITARFDQNNNHIIFEKKKNHKRKITLGKLIFDHKINLKLKLITIKTCNQQL
jgi:hypothetical protein